MTSNKIEFDLIAQWKSMRLPLRWFHSIKVFRFCVAKTMFLCARAQCNSFPIQFGLNVFKLVRHINRLS